MRRVSLIVACLVLATSSCSSQSPSQVRASHVYEASIRWLASQDPVDPDPLRIFVESRGEGTAIALDVQAEVIAATEDVAEVRFIDARDEALSETDDGAFVVRDDGLLVRLGPVVEDGERITLELDRWLVDNTFTTFQLTLRRTGEDWEMLNDPITTGTLEVDE
jgi:S1-C subfamily serine protease